MAAKRVQLKPKAKSMTSAPGRVQRLALFGPPPLLAGEDADKYDELLARMCAAVNPVDVIDEMFVADMIFLQWEILRLRRLKLSLLMESEQEAVKSFLSKKMDFELYAEIFVENLAQILEESLPEDQAQKLALQCAKSEPDAVEKVKELLAGDEQDLDLIHDEAESARAEEFAQAYARRESEAIDKVNEILASAGLTIDNINAKALMGKIDKIERIERLITVAETRRNLSLRELGRHRAVLAEALRQKLPEIEDAEYKEIESMHTEGRTRRDQ
jgi:hypothetical protein